MRKLVICIVGPTASGKTELSQIIAERLDGEIISADSMQIYRGMNIGTGKLPVSERRVPHYGFDLVSPGEAYSASLFQSYARSCFDQIDQKDKRAILCGGTGFYVRAALDDYHFPKGEQVDNPVRDRYRQLLEAEGEQALWDTLNTKDPASAALVHPHNTRRVIRALELFEAGESYARQVENLKHLPEAIPAAYLGLSVEPRLLNARIERRVDDMIANGLVEEVLDLLSKGYIEGLTAQQAIGYKEIVKMLDGEISEAEAIEQIKTATRRYGKRQRSWFKRDKRITWLDANEGITGSLVEDALRIIEERDAQYAGKKPTDDETRQQPCRQ